MADKANGEGEYTLIRVTKEQREMLKEAKFDFRVQTYEEVVTLLLREHAARNGSAAGGGKAPAQTKLTD